MVTERPKMYKNQDYPARQFIIICAQETNSTKRNTLDEKSLERTYKTIIPSS